MRLHRYEQAIMLAHREGLELALEMRAFQHEEGLTAVAGHRAFAKIDAAQAQLSAAISDAAHGHSLLRTLALRIGVDATMVGERTDPEEEDSKTRRNTGLLAAVA